MGKKKSIYGPGLFFLIGLVLTGESFLIPPSSEDYPKRWLVPLFGLMIIAMGSLLLQQKHKDRFSEEVNQILRGSLSIVVFGVFSVVFLAGASVFGDELTGGSQFLPSGVNNLIGRILFGLVGGVVALVTIFKATTIRDGDELVDLSCKIGGKSVTCAKEGYH